VTARWFDPTSGTFTAISGSPFANTGSHNFTTPGNNSNGDGGLGPGARRSPAGLAPSAPTNLAATASDAQVSLSWTASSGASTTMSIVPRAAAARRFCNRASPGPRSQHRTDQRHTYFYKVAAVNASGTSGLSSEVSATPQAVPAAPTNLTATPGNTQISLSWTASSGASTYNVYRSTSSGSEDASAIGPHRDHVHQHRLTNGTTYFLQGRRRQCFRDQRTVQ